MFFSKDEIKDFRDGMKTMEDTLKDFSVEFFGRSVLPYYSQVNENKDTKLAIELPGVNKEDIKIYFENGLLVVEAHTKTWYNTYNYKNRYVVKNANEDSVSAEYKNGVLEITVKQNEIKKKTIKIE